MSSDSKTLSYESIVSSWTNLSKSLNPSSSIVSEGFASYLDSQDELACYRKEFHIPSKTALANRNHVGIIESSLHSSGKDDEAVYLCGNSLGLQPRRSKQLIDAEMNKWGNIGVEGHFCGNNPWATVDAEVTALIESIVGAAPNASEVAICNSLSVNLHLLLISFYRPTAKKFKLLIEESAFCSDHHVVRSQLAMHNLTAEHALIQLKPRQGEYTLRNEDILEAISLHGPELCCILLAGVQFYTGQLFDLKAITAAGHAVQATVGFDLAHAAGNVELKLHDWGVDFAAWCSYKYLNSGPGSIAGLFVHENHHANQLTRLSGWWGQPANVRFLMAAEHSPAKGAQAYLMSNPAVLPTICLQASLDIFNRATMQKLRQKSLQLTSYAQYCVEAVKEELKLSNNTSVTITTITPSDIQARGCQLSLLFNTNAEPILHLLEKESCICDLRRPNVIRVSPAPLYNNFSDIYQFSCILKTVLSNYKP
jgi:kynureninase